MNILGLLLIIDFLMSFNLSSMLKLQLEKFIYSTDLSLNLKLNEFKSNSNSNHSHNHSHIHITKNDLPYKSFLLTSFLNFLFNYLIVLLIAHPQINNRVLTTCPILYFYCADNIAQFCRSKNTHKTGLFIVVFFIIFSILGCVMQTGSYGFA